MYRTSMDPMGSGGLNCFWKANKWTISFTFHPWQIPEPTWVMLPLPSGLGFGTRTNLGARAWSQCCHRKYSMSLGTHIHTPPCVCVYLLSGFFGKLYLSLTDIHLSIIATLAPNESKWLQYLRSDSSTNDQAVFVGLPGFAKSCLASIVFWLDVAPSVVALSANKNLKEHNLLDTLPIFWCTSCKFVYLPKKHTFLVCQDTWNSPVLAEKKQQQSLQRNLRNWTAWCNLDTSTGVIILPT